MKSNHKMTEETNQELESFSKQLQALTDVIHSHDRILTSDNMVILLEMIEEAKRLKTIHANDIERAEKIAKTSGFILGLAGTISAFIYIYHWFISHIK